MILKDADHDLGTSTRGGKDEVTIEFEGTRWFNVDAEIQRDEGGWKEKGKETSVCVLSGTDHEVCAK